MVLTVSKEFKSLIKDLIINGIYIAENAIDYGLIDSVMKDVECNRQSLLENKVGGVYLSSGQYYHPHLTAVSNAFYRILFSSTIIDTCKAYFGHRPFRLKCHRYYENYSWPPVPGKLTPFYLNHLGA